MPKKKKKVTVVVGVAVGDNGEVEYCLVVDPDKRARKELEDLVNYDEASFSGCQAIEISIAEFTLNVPKTKKIKVKKIKPKKVETVEQEQTDEDDTTAALDD